MNWAKEGDYLLLLTKVITQMSTEGFGIQGGF